MILRCDMLKKQNQKWRSGSTLSGVSSTLNYQDVMFSLIRLVSLKHQSLAIWHLFYLFIYTFFLNSHLPSACKAQKWQHRLQECCRAIVREGLAQSFCSVTVSGKDGTHTLGVTGQPLQVIGKRASGQLWVSNLSIVATHWLEVDWNVQPSGYKAQIIPLHHDVPQNVVV